MHTAEQLNHTTQSSSHLLFFKNYKSIKEYDGIKISHICHINDSKFTYGKKIFSNHIAI